MLSSAPSPASSPPAAEAQTCVHGHPPESSKVTDKGPCPDRREAGNGGSDSAGLPSLVAAGPISGGLRGGESRRGRRAAADAVQYRDPDHAATVGEPSMSYHLMTLLHLGPLTTSTPEPAEGTPREGTPAGVVCHVQVLSDNVPDVSGLEAWRKSFLK